MNPEDAPCLPTDYPPRFECMQSVPYEPPPTAAPLPESGADAWAAALVWTAVLLFLVGVAAIGISNRRR